MHQLSTTSHQLSTREKLYHCSYHGFVAVFAAWVEGKPEISGFSCGTLVLNLEETTVLDAQRHLKNDDLMVVIYHLKTI
jgi:hypothetical protein